jgi:hypothetical protein
MKIVVKILIAIAATVVFAFPLQKVVTLGKTSSSGTKNIPAAITFYWSDPTTPFAIHDGDNKGAFSNNVDGSEVFLDSVNGGNLVFIANFYRSKTQRLGYMDLTHPLSPLYPDYGLWPAITVNFGCKLYGLLPMTVGQVKYDQARFHSELNGDLTQARFGVTADDGSSLAKYTRVSATQWIVQTEGINDIAQVTHGPAGSEGAIGLYHVPFYVVVNKLQ